MSRTAGGGTGCRRSDLAGRLQAGLRGQVALEAGRHPGRDELDFPPRYRLDEDGRLSTDYTRVPLPRTGTVYTEVTVHVPVPGLRSPSSLVILELDEVDVRALVKVTGTDPGTVRIGDRGRMVLRRVAVRSGVPGYGYATHSSRTRRRHLRRPRARGGPGTAAAVGHLSEL